MNNKQTLNIGFDLDGVVANFAKAYSTILNQLFGTPIIEHTSQVLDWNWESWYGLPKSAFEKANLVMYGTQDFWCNNIDPINAEQLYKILWLPGLHPKLNLYFITSRSETSGSSVIRQTRDWLEMRNSITPYSIISTLNKGTAAKLLKLDYFIDDNPMHILDIEKTYPECQATLLEYPYNKNATVARRIAHNKFSDYVASLEDVARKFSEFRPFALDKVDVGK